MRIPTIGGYAYRKDERLELVQEQGGPEQEGQEKTGTGAYLGAKFMEAWESNPLVSSVAAGKVEATKTSEFYDEFGRPLAVEKTAEGIQVHGPATRRFAFVNDDSDRADNMLAENVATAQEAERKVLTEDQWKESPYYRDGLTFSSMRNHAEAPVYTETAEILAEKYDVRQKRSEIIERADAGVFKGALGLGVGLVASLFDPYNIALSFIPVAGELNWARRLGPTGARLIRGSIEGAVGNAMVEPLVYLSQKEQQAEYGLMDSATNLLFGAVMGAGLHAGLGKLGDMRSPGVIEEAPKIISEGFDFNSPGDRQSLLDLGYTDEDIRIGEDYAKKSAARAAGPVPELRNPQDIAGAIFGDKPIADHLDNVAATMLALEEGKIPDLAEAARWREVERRASPEYIKPQKKELKMMVDDDGYAITDLDTLFEKQGIPLEDRKNYDLRNLNLEPMRRMTKEERKARNIYQATTDAYNLYDGLEIIRDPETRRDLIIKRELDAFPAKKAATLSNVVMDMYARVITETATLDQFRIEVGKVLKKEFPNTPDVLTRLDAILDTVTRGERSADEVMDAWILAQKAEFETLVGNEIPPFRAELLKKTKLEPVRERILDESGRIVHSEGREAEWHPGVDLSIRKATARLHETANQSYKVRLDEHLAAKEELRTKSEELLDAPAVPEKAVWDNALKLNDGTIISGMNDFGRPVRTHQELYALLSPEQQAQVGPSGFMVDGEFREFRGSADDFTGKAKIEKTTGPDLTKITDERLTEDLESHSRDLVEDGKQAISDDEIINRLIGCD